MDAKPKSHSNKSSQEVSVVNAGRTSRAGAVAGAGKSGRKASQRSTYGLLAGTVHIKGDIVGSLVDGPKKRK